MAPKRSGGDGRKKTVLRRIGKSDARHVCFSKRKRGLFSKASALALLTGAQVAAVAFSPGGKAFSFGHSSVDAVVNRFMAGGGNGVQRPADDNRLQELDRQDGKMRAELAERRKRKKRADEALNKERAKGDQIASWLHPDMRGKGYDYEDMAAFETALMQVQAAVSGRANQVLVELFGASTFELGSSSNSNAGIEMQHMQMATHPPQGFAAGMEMQMPMHPPQGFAAGMEMQMAIPQQSGFTGGMETEMLMTMLPATPEFPAGMDLPQQGLGPNPGYPY